MHQHPHHFNFDYSHGEKNTKLVILLTAITMIIEIIVGSLSGSMALLADGWHMGTHVAALSITVFAYIYTRHHAQDERYSFGTGKVGSLGGFASGIVLAVIAILMAIESLQRLMQPHLIHFDEAIAVAFLGLIVNVISMWLLHHPHEHDDHNLKAAYLHVLADALTSLLAIIALVTGKAFGWVWLDPVMGIVGASIILRWSWGLLRDTSHLLLDHQTDSATLTEIRHLIENNEEDQITDLHIWRIAPHQSAAIISIVTHASRSPEYYKNLLAHRSELVHLTVEIYAGQGNCHP